jgi:hypothetical protein
MFELKPDSVYALPYPEYFWQRDLKPVELPLSTNIFRVD